jgi:hypothetical protein
MFVQLLIVILTLAHTMCVGNFTPRAFSLLPIDCRGHLQHLPLRLRDECSHHGVRKEQIHPVRAADDCEPTLHVTAPHSVVWNCDATMHAPLSVARCSQHIHQQHRFGQHWPASTSCPPPPPPLPPSSSSSSCTVGPTSPVVFHAN